MIRFWIFLLALVAAVEGFPTTALAGWSGPRITDQVRLASFLEQNSSEGLLILRNWTLLEVEADEAKGGLSGKQVRVVEYLIGDKSLLEDAAQVWTLDSPRRPLEDVRITVTRDDKKTHFKKKDLKWSKATHRSGSVVYLDGTQSVGFIPGLQVGDRVEVVKSHELAGVFGLGEHLLGDSDSPCFQSGLEVRIPQKYTLVFGTMGPSQGKDRLVHQAHQDGKWIKNTWIMEASPDGSLPTCGGDYPVVRITPHLSSTGREGPLNVGVGADWTEVGNAYLQRIQTVFDADTELKTKAAEVVEGAETAHDKIDRIYRYVQSTCHYLGLYEGMGNMIPLSATEVRDVGSGDCKGLSTLLIAMLRAVGVPAHPALVRTRDAGPLNQAVPNMTQFNHYIAWADDGQGGIYLDGTTDFYPAGMLPSQDIAWPVLLLRPSAPRLETVPARTQYSGLVQISITGSLNQSEIGGHNLDLAMECTLTDRLGASWRSYLAGLSGREREDAILRALLPDDFPMGGSEVSVEGLQDWSGPLIIRAKAKTSTPLPKVPGRIFLPRTLTGIGFEAPGLPACGSSRDLRPQAEMQYQWKIHMPAGFKLASPDSSEIEEAGFAWKETIIQMGQDLLLERKFRFTEPFVNREEAEVMSEKIKEVKKGLSGYFELRF